MERFILRTISDVTLREIADREDDDLNEASVKMWDSFIEYDRDINRYFMGYNEVDLDTWNNLINMYNEIRDFVNSKLKNYGRGN